MTPTQKQDREQQCLALEATHADSPPAQLHGCAYVCRDACAKRLACSHTTPLGAPWARTVPGIKKIKIIIM